MDLFSDAPSCARWTMLALRWSVAVIYPLQKHSHQPAQHSGHLRPQRFGSGISGNTSLVSGPAKPWEMDPHACRPRVRALLIQARPLGTKHELKRTRSQRQCKNCRIGKIHRHSGHSNADFQLSPTQPAARRSKAAPIVQVKSSPHGPSSTVAQECPETISSSHLSTSPSSLWCTMPQ